MTITRVRYRERQPLRAVDLSDEQAHRIAMRRRHNIAHHTWGVVRGLELAVEEGRPVVQPGMAVDGYGRELIVPQPVVLPAEAFERLESDAFDVWLVYGRVPVTPPQRGRWDCGPGRHSRWHEEARLRLTPATAIDPRRPPEVPEAHLDVGPHQEPPDDPAQAWPVYLGRVTRTSSDPAAYAVDRTQRPYAALIGEAVTAPSDRARMQVGSETAADRRRFVVRLVDEGGVFVDRLTVDRDGNATLHGDATLRGGDLVIAAVEAPETAVEPRRVPGCDDVRDQPREEEQVRSVQFDPMAAPPEEAAPWRIYHVVVTESDMPMHQLRLEIGHPGDEGDPTRHKLVVGHTDDSGAFVPCLTITADCTVTVHGDLISQGQVIEGPIQADPDDPRFGVALLDRWVRGLATAGTQVDAFYAGELAVEVEAPEAVWSGEELSYTVVVRNSGRGAVTDVQVHETLAVNDKVQRREEVERGLTLEPGASAELGRTFQVPGDGADTIRIAVMALGVGPAGSVVSASASRTVQIQLPIG